MLMEKYLRAESPAETQQVLRPPKGTNRGRGSADSTTKAKGIGSWTSGSQSPGYLWLLFAGPGAHESGARL